MIEIDIGAGRKARLFETQRYLPSVDGEGLHLSVWWMGRQVWCETKVEPGRSLREARENGVKALTAAIKDGKHGQVII